MATYKKIFKHYQKPKSAKILKRHSTSLYFFFAVILFLVLFSIVFSNNSLSPTVLQPALAESQSEATSIASASVQSNQLVNTKPQFDVHVTYAYVGPRKEHFTSQNPLQGKSSIATLNAKSLYPVVVCFNFTHILNAEVESCDAKMEVYDIQITADTGTKESYIYAEATNYDPAFSALDTLSSHISDFDEALATNGLGGGFIFNWTTNTSSLDGRVGSYNSYTSKDSGLGLWSAGEPNTITVNVRRIGSILVEGKSVTTDTFLASENLAQVQLEKYGDGFLYNSIVSKDRLSQIDLFFPPIPNS